MNTSKKRLVNRLKKKSSYKSKIQGTPDRPRVCVFRSSSHIYIQAVDDINRVTLSSASTCDGDIKKMLEGASGNITAATLVGNHFGKKLIAGGIQKVVFDRGGYLYHGRIKSLADAIREAGIQF